MTTIFALSSGPPPSGIAVVRISGPAACDTLATLTDRPLPPPRMMVVRRLIGRDGALLDEAMVVRFVAPHSATGEDLVELHLHGGVAIIAAVIAALAGLGLSSAGAGAFTRRAYAHGKLDLAAVEALGDLIAAETDGQRRAALERRGDRLAALVDDWRATLLEIRAEIEATLDFAEEDDVVARLSTRSYDALRMLLTALQTAHADGRRGALIRNGVTVALVGPVNAGKSTLLNALAGRDVALVSHLPGTTRDVIEVHLALGGLLVTLIDTAGLRDTLDPLEIEGIRRGVGRARHADLVVDFGAHPVANSIAVAGKADLDGRRPGWRNGVLHLSPLTGAGLDLLEAHLADRVAALVRPGDAPVIAHASQMVAIGSAAMAVEVALVADDPVIVADELRTAMTSLDELIGRVTAEQVLDEVFARFCIGK